MTGFPLQFYAHLDGLRNAYDSTKTVTLKNDECHINFNEASEDLPDITLLETETYALIRDNVSFVIRAIILQAINWREGVLKVAVPDTYGPGGVEMRLGTRLHRAIKYALRKGPCPAVPCPVLERMGESGLGSRLGVPLRLRADDLDSVESGTRRTARRCVVPAPELL